ncbi:MAG TPA: RNA polymerase sigma-70 factor [Chitinophagaceae bacterium]|nr:RNA polymerase sigma-70 factor [Chitinophagaceae bacterium]
MSVTHKILPNEKELFARITSGDIVAFEEIYHHYNQFLQPFLLNKTKSLELTEEIIQELYLKLWDRRETLPSIENYRSYIYTMAVNAVYTHFRKAAVEQKILKKLWRGMTEQQSTTDEIMEFKESEALINQAVEKLPPQQKKIYLLSRRSGLSHDEIADELHISKRTVSNQVTEALKAIRLHLGKATVFIILLFR